MNDELPEGWSSLALGEIAEIRGGIQKQPKRAPKANPYPYLRVANVLRGRLDLEQIERMELFGDEPKVYALAPGDLLVVEGNGSISEIGRSALWRGEISPCVHQNHIIRVRSRACLPEFLDYFWNSPFGVDQVSAAAVTTSGLYSLSTKKVAAVVVPVAPLAEQHRLVDKLRSLLEQVNRAKARLERVPLILKRYRQAVLAAACSGELTKDWRSGCEGEESGAAFLRALLGQRPARFERDQAGRSSGRRNRYKEPVACEEGEGLPDLPESWTWASLDALTIKIVDGVHKKPTYVKSGVPFVTVRNLTAGAGVDLSNLNYITRADHLEYVDRANPERGDLLISKDGTLGVVRAIRTVTEFSVFVSVALLKPVSTKMTDYLELALSAPQVQQRMVPTGSGLQHLHLRDLKTVPVPVPPQREQQEIVQRVRRLFVLADAIEKRVATAKQRAERLPQAVLSTAFSGELVPTEAEVARVEGRAYETATDLLTKIKAGPPALGRHSSNGRRRGRRGIG